MPIGIKLSRQRSDLKRYKLSPVKSKTLKVPRRKASPYVHEYLVERLSTISQLYTAQQRESGVFEKEERVISTVDEMNDLLSNSDPLVWKYLEEDSLGFFSLDNPIRIACIKTIMSGFFTWFIFGAICVNAVLLALDNPLSTKGDEFFAVAEVTFNTLFTVEFIIKIVALSAFGTVSGYYRDSWNRLDFVVLVVSWIPFLFSGSVNFSFIRIMRSMKVMKTFNNIPGLKRMVALFANVVPKLASLVYLLAFLFLFFGIFGGQLFRGKMRQHCFPLEAYDSSTTNNTVYPPSEELCSLDPDRAGGLQCPAETPECSAYYPLSDDPVSNPAENKYLNFDNTLFSFLSIFVVISLEGWTDIMFQLSDTSGYSATLYFVLLVVIGSFFLINLIVAVVYNAYLSTFEEHINEKVEKYLLKVHKKKMKKEAQRASSLSLISVLHSKKLVPGFMFSFFQESKRYKSFKLMVRRMVKSSAFIICINGVIVYNMITLAIEVNGASESASDFLYISNFVCIVIFVVELVLRFIAFSIVYFFHSASNIFDALIVFFGVLELFYLKTNSPITVLRTIRLFRLIKLMKQWKSLQQFIECIVRCTRGLGPFFVILALFLFICTLSGMSIFAGKLDQSNDVFDSRANFDTFFLSFVSTFQIISGENWNLILLTSMDYNPYLGAIFCLIIYSLGFIVVLNVFLAVMLESFSTRYDDGVSYYELLEDQKDISTILSVFSKCLKYIWSSLLPVKKDSNEDEAEPSSPRRNGIHRQYKAHTLTPNKTDPNSAWDGWEQYSFQERSDNLSAKFIEDEAFCKRMLEEIPLGSYRSDDVKVQRNCFTGAELVDYLLDNNIVSNLEEAVAMGQELLFMKKIELVHLAGDVPTAHQPEKAQRIADPKFGDDRSLYRLGMIGRQVTEWLASSKDIEDEMKANETQRLAYHKQRLLDGKSFNLFDRHSRIRQLCVDVISSRAFDNAIILLILISIVLIASEDPSGGGSDTRIFIFYILDIVFTSIFTLEMALKMIACGVFKTKNSYFSSGWNRLDFVIVTVSVLSVSVESLDFDYLRVLRVMRALRPLRLVSHSPELKAAFRAIVLITKPLLSFALVVNVLLLTFAIFGTALFRDKLKFCHSISDDLDVDLNEFRYTVDKQDCYGTLYSENNATITLDWRSVDSNFDSVSNSFLTLYEMITLDNWPNIMYPAMDISKEGHHPVLNQTQYNAIFFIIFVIVGAFCIGNVLVGIVVNKFSRSIIDGKSERFLTDEQQKWLDAMKIAMTAKPLRRTPLPSKTALFGFKRPIFFIVMDRRFQNIMDFMIVANMFSMTIDYFNQPDELSRATFVLELVFSLIFSVEITLRFLAVEPKEFFKVTWNVLDLLIVVGSMVGVFMSSSSIKISIFRLFRVGRILRLVKKSKNLTILVKTLHLSIFSLLNIGLLLFLSLFVFAVVGMHLFWDVDIDGRVLTDQQNFRSLGVTMLLLFRCITGEGWTAIMHYLRDEGFTEISPIYFIFFLTVNQYVLLSLFVAIILNNFATALQYDPDKVNKRNLEDFINVWAEIHDEIGSGDREYYLPSYTLVSLLQRTGAPLGLKNVSQEVVCPDENVDKITYIVRLIHTLELKEDSRGNINFIDTVAALIRNLHRRDGDESSKEIMMSEEQKHELQMCLTKMCKTRLIDKIRESTKNEVFSDIDLAVVFNCAVLVQSRWRGIKGRREFVKLWYKAHPSLPLLKSYARRYSDKDLQVEAKSRPSLIEMLFRADSKETGGTSTVSPSRAEKRTSIHEVVRNSFASLGSTLSRSGSRSYSNSDEGSCSGSRWKEPRIERTSSSSFQLSSPSMTAEEVEKFKVLEEKRRTGLTAPTINAEIPDYEVSTDVMFDYSPPPDGVVTSVNMLASRPPPPISTPNSKVPAPDPASPVSSPLNPASKPLLYKKFTPTRHDSITLALPLSPTEGERTLSREELFQRTRRNRSSYSITEENEEELSDSADNNKSSASILSGLKITPVNEVGSSEEEEEEVVSLENLDDDNVFNSSGTDWSISTRSTKSDSLSAGDDKLEANLRSPGKSSQKLVMKRTPSRGRHLQSKMSHPPRVSVLTSTPIPSFERPPLVRRNSSSSSITLDSYFKTLRESSDYEDLAETRRRTQEAVVKQAQAHRERAVARIKAAQEEKTAIALQEEKIMASLRSKERDRVSSLLRKREEEEIAAAIAKAKRDEEKTAALQLAKREQDKALALARRERAEARRKAKEERAAARKAKAEEIDREIARIHALSEQDGSSGVVFPERAAREGGEDVETPLHRSSLHGIPEESKSVENGERASERSFPLNEDTEVQTDPEEVLEDDEPIEILRSVLSSRGGPARPVHSSEKEKTNEIRGMKTPLLEKSVVPSEMIVQDSPEVIEEVSTPMYQEYQERSEKDGSGVRRKEERAGEKESTATKKDSRQDENEDENEDEDEAAVSIKKQSSVNLDNMIESLLAISSSGGAHALKEPQVDDSKHANQDNPEENEADTSVKSQKSSLSAAEKKKKKEEKAKRKEERAKARELKAKAKEERAKAKAERRKAKELERMAEEGQKAESGRTPQGHNSVILEDKKMLELSKVYEQDEHITSGGDYMTLEDSRYSTPQSSKPQNDLQITKTSKSNRISKLSESRLSPFLRSSSSISDSQSPNGSFMSNTTESPHGRTIPSRLSSSQLQPFLKSPEKVSSASSVRSRAQERGSTSPQSSVSSRVASLREQFARSMSIPDSTTETGTSSPREGSKSKQIVSPPASSPILGHETT